jgi:hypothetical protein
VSDLSGLVKSLQSLKAVHLRYIESKANGVFNGGDQKLALLDGGATHGLRRGLPHELEGAEMVTVELAHGSTSLFRKAGCSRLLAKEEVEPIIPVRQLIEAGYTSSSGVPLKFPFGIPQKDPSNAGDAKAAPSWIEMMVHSSFTNVGGR